MQGFAVASYVAASRSHDNVHYLSAVFHNYGDVFLGQAARLISLALSLDNRSARSTRVNVH